MMEYTADFWKRAQELQDKHPRTCEQCGQVEAPPQGRFKGVSVWLCYVGPDVGAARADWLHLFCTACKDTKHLRLRAARPRRADVLTLPMFTAGPPITAPR